MRARIGVLVGQLAQMGGVGIAAVEEVKNMKQMGCDVELVVLKRRNKFSGNYDTTGLPVRFISDELPEILTASFKIPLFSFFSFFHLSFPILAPFVIKKRDYGCLIVHETYNIFTAISLKWFSGIPYFPLVWDPISYIIPRVYEKKALSLVFPILLPLSRLLDYLIVKEARVVLLGSNKHLPFLRELNIQGVFKVVYSGCYPLEKIPESRGDFIVSLTKWDMGKNPFFLLELLRNLKNKNARLIMAGNWVQGSLRNDFIQKAKEMNIFGRVEITGWVNEERKTKLLSEARVLIHPIIEAFGMFALEAASCGCPAIVPKGSGFAELFQDGIHGYFPEESDIVTFTNDSNELLGDERKAWEMGRASWEIAQQNTWRVHARRLVSVVEDYL